MYSLDYSNVHEPDYNPAAPTESQLQTLLKDLRPSENRWQNKEQLAKKQ